MTYFALIHRPNNDNIQALNVPIVDLAISSLDSLGFPYELITEKQYNDRIDSYKTRTTL